MKKTTFYSSCICLGFLAVLLPFAEAQTLDNQCRDLFSQSISGTAMSQFGGMTSKFTDGGDKHVIVTEVPSSFVLGSSFPFDSFSNVAQEITPYVHNRHYTPRELPQLNYTPMNWWEVPTNKPYDFAEKGKDDHATLPSSTKFIPYNAHVIPRTRDSVQMELDFWGNTLFRKDDISDCIQLDSFRSQAQCLALIAIEETASLVVTGGIVKAIRFLGNARATRKMINAADELVPPTKIIPDTVDIVPKQRQKSQAVTDLMPGDPWVSHSNVGKQVPPGTQPFARPKYNPRTGEIEESLVIPDRYGRVETRIDFSSHGYGDHKRIHRHDFEYSGKYPEGHKLPRHDYDPLE